MAAPLVGSTPDIRCVSWTTADFSGVEQGGQVTLYLSVLVAGAATDLTTPSLAIRLGNDPTPLTTTPVHDGAGAYHAIVLMGTDAGEARYAWTGNIPGSPHASPVSSSGRFFITPVVNI